MIDWYIWLLCGFVSSLIFRSILGAFSVSTWILLIALGPAPVLMIPVFFIIAIPMCVFMTVCDLPALRPLRWSWRRANNKINAIINKEF